MAGTLKGGLQKTPGGLAVTKMYGQHTTTGHGSYTRMWITKTPGGLAGTLMYGQCTTNTHGSYAGMWITKTPLDLYLTKITDGSLGIARPQDTLRMASLSE